MKAGLVCPYSWDVPGGVQEHIRDLAEALMDLWGSAPGISRLVEVHFRELVTRRTFINRVAADRGLIRPQATGGRPLAGASRQAGLLVRVSGLPGGLSRSSPSAPLPVAGAAPWPPRPSPARFRARCPADLPAGRVPSGMCRCQVWVAAAPAWPCSQWQHCMDQ